LEARSLLSSAGSLDPTFGSGGIVTSGGLNGSPGDGVAIQGNGKIVTVADVINSNKTRSAAVFRFNPDGSVDTSFGNKGVAKAQLTKNSSADDYAMAIQGDGKILVAGRTTTGSGTDFFLARFNMTGALDTSFGSGGMVYTSFGNNGDEAYAIVVQTDGKIVLAGRTFLPTGAVGALARYNPNGSLDSNFGSGGKVVLSADGFAIANGLALQADGKIVAVGEADPVSGGGWPQDFGVVRYLTNGTLDPSFGSGGIVLTAPASTAPNTATAVAIQADGKIVVAGVTNYASGGGGSDAFGLVRYNVGVTGQTDGSLDTTFGSGGIVITPLGGGADAYALALQADGKIVVAGQTHASTAFVLARYDVGVTGQADGTLDTAFGSGGIVTTSGPGNSGQALGVAIYPTSDPTNGGKIVAAGDYNNGRLSLMLSRYLGSATSSSMMATATAVRLASGSTSPALQQAVSLGIAPGDDLMSPIVPILAGPRKRSIFGTFELS
jgi:uncharacterized delta-60 repeat protein